MLDRFNSAVLARLTAGGAVSANPMPSPSVNTAAIAYDGTYTYLVSGTPAAAYQIRQFNGAGVQVAQTFTQGTGDAAVTTPSAASFQNIRSMAGGPITVTEVPPAEPVKDNLIAFARAVRGEASYPISGEDLVNNITILEAAIKSAAGDGL